MNYDKMRVLYHQHLTHWSKKRVWPQWMGYPVVKYPADMLTYAQIIWQTKPDFIVECGTEKGGSALFFAHLLDILKRGRVISIDIKNRERSRRLPRHRRILYLSGSSIDETIIARVRGKVQARRCMVILDSDHAENHVTQELAAYHGLVTPGCYLVVEDTSANGHPLRPKHGPGPYEAVEKFLSHHPEFVGVPWEARMLFSLNPGGWLQRVS